MTAGSDRDRRRRLSAAAILCVLLAAGGAAVGQYGFRRNMPPRFPGPDFHPDGNFAFCRLYYDQVRYEALGQGWFTDYPDSDSNLMIRLSEVTRAPVRHDPRGRPDHVVVHATDEELMAHPFLFMSDGGTVGWDDQEVRALRQYLLKGGFLWADDFWGDAAWSHWVSQIGRVLPEYAIVDVALDHPMLRMFFELGEVPQVPSIQYWRWSGGDTSERGEESAIPHLRAIFDETGRPMVLMSHNTDIADGWEREGESHEFFERFSIPKSYPLGINVVLYSLIR